MRNFLRVLLASLFLSIPAVALSASPADPIYEKALTSFLEGDYDKALLLSAQSLEKDPAHVKTKNLINVLAAEKEQEGKTVIWLAGKPAVVPVAQAQPQTILHSDDGLRDALKRLEAKLDRSHSTLTGRQEVTDGRVRTVQELLQENDQAKYREVRAAQAEIYKKLEEMEKGRTGPDLLLLYLLCGGSLLFSLAALVRSSRKG
jgi:hypothetical protein